jgi:hypothetical protein
MRGAASIIRPTIPAGHYATISEALPRRFVFVAGQVADRYDRKPIIIAASDRLAEQGV